MNGAIQASFLRRPPDRGSGRPEASDEVTAQRAWPLKGAAAMRSVDDGGLLGEPQSGLPSSVRVAVSLTVCLAAAGAAVALNASTVMIACLAVLAAGASALGWSLSDKRRLALQAEVDARTTELRRALSELEIAQAETVQRLSMAVEFRDEDTGAHIERIGRFSVLLAEHIGMDPVFCERLKHAAPLHDVGKVAIPDAILLKPGPLTPEERAIVETHAEEGHRLVSGSSSSILDMAAVIALSHQEKWDGTGYPRGLRGEAIPIEGRIVAVVDVFDALTSDRVYRDAFSVADATQMMREQRGRHFDPVLLDAFMEVLGRSGPDAREQLRSDPQELAENTLETFASALERGDAEMAEGAIAQAIEDGISPGMLHAEVIGPALRRMDLARGAGGGNREIEVRAETITRRVLATLRRYMTGSTTATRERVLILAIDGDRHTLGLQMVHDQLAAAGFHAVLETGVHPGALPALVADESPDVLVVGSSGPDSEGFEQALGELAASWPALPLVLGGLAVGGALPRERCGATILERVDESVLAVETLIAKPAPAASL